MHQTAIHQKRCNLWQLLIASTTLTLLLGTQQVAASKDYYKWTDDNGTVHYSGQQPANKDATTVRTTDIHGNSPQADKTTETDTSPVKKSKTAKRTEKTKSPERCAWAKKTLKIMAESPRIKIKEEGATESRRLSEEEYAERKAEAQKAANDHC